MSLPQARNVLTCKLIYGRSRKEALEICQLTHDLYASILEEELVDHDFYFLNVHAKSYCENAEASRNEWSPPYKAIKVLIQELFSEVPENLRHNLLQSFAELFQKRTLGENQRHAKKANY